MFHADDFKTKFNLHFPVVVKSLLEDPQRVALSGSLNVELALKRMKESLEYNVPFGKKTRGLTVLHTYNKICNKDLTPTVEHRLLSLGWAVEILQASFLVADDVMDQSETRRGKPCWFKRDNIKLSAINDAFLLESCVFVLLKQACRSEPYYADLVDLFHSTIMNTELGQSLDMVTTDVGNFSLFTDDHYLNTVTYKTAFYSFYLPVAVSMYMNGYNDQQLHKKVCDVLLKIGQLFQIQDDYLDCFGDSNVTGKIGTDIQDNKCSWLIVQALKIGKEEDVEELKHSYGRNEVDKVKRVKAIFEKLELEDMFKSYEKKLYQEICKDIEKFDGSVVPQTIFMGLLEKIYLREK